MIFKLHPMGYGEIHVSKECKNRVESSGLLSLFYVNNTGKEIETRGQISHSIIKCLNICILNKTSFQWFFQTPNQTFQSF